MEKIIDNNPALWPDVERFLFYIPDQLIPISPKYYGRRIYELRTAEKGKLKEIKDRELKTMVGSRAEANEKKREYRHWGYSREALAKEVGITQQALARIEEGKNRKIKKEYVPIFAKKLSCSCSYLLGYTDKINGVWCNPQDGLLLPTELFFPITPCRADEKITIDCIIRAYNQDPDLCFMCLRLLKEDSPERRGTYKKHIKELLESTQK